MMAECSLCELEGVRFGNSQNLAAATGCTVILCPGGAVAGVDVRGGAPGNARNRSVEAGKSRRKDSCSHARRWERIRTGCGRWRYAISGGSGDRL